MALDQLGKNRMTQVTVAAMQIASTDTYETNMATADRVIRAAAPAGAQIVLPGEMFSSHEFQFMEMDAAPFALAEDLDGPTVSHMRALARELSIVIPTNIFERANKSQARSVSPASDA